MTVPKIKFALSGWQVPIKMIKITRNLVDGQVVESAENIDYIGSVQPLQAETLKIQPLELRSWEWLQIFTKTQFELVINDFIEYNNKKYKVMAKKNYSLYNYIEYHVMEAYE